MKDAQRRNGVLIMLLAYAMVAFFIMCADDAFRGDLSDLIRESTDSLAEARNDDTLAFPQATHGVSDADTIVVDDCGELITFDQNYTYCAAVSYDVGMIDSVRVRAIAYGVTNTATLDSMDQLQPLLYSTFGFESNVVYNDVDFSTGKFDFFAIIKTPSIMYGANTYDRPQLIFDLYGGGQLFKRVIADFWEYSVRITGSMTFAQTYAVVSNYEHRNLYASKSTLTQNEIFGIVKFYRDNCITGNVANFYGLGIDSVVYRIMADTLQWQTVKL